MTILKATSTLVQIPTDDMMLEGLLTYPQTICSLNQEPSRQSPS
jgi:hypothetical protein